MVNQLTGSTAETSSRQPVVRKNIRVIPRLDIKGPNLVKGIHLEGLRVLGKPWDFALKYYQDGADELIYIDAVASLYGRNTLTDIVEKTAQNIFIPLTVGGGVRSLEDMRRLLRAGADKVAINTAAVHNPDLIREGAETFGSQCIVLSVQAKYLNNRYEVLTDNGREVTGREVTAWVQQAVELGAGEILLTSVDNEGTGKGFDIQLVKHIADMVPVPVIACGGAGRKGHINEVVEQGHADAVSCASLFHYHRLEQQVNTDDFKDEGNIEFIKEVRNGLKFVSQRLVACGIQDVKKELSEAGFACRKRDNCGENA